MAAIEKELYCLCKTEYEADQFMIECDKCKDWFHGRCIGIDENQAQDIDVYHCPSCEKSYGPLTLKRRRMTQRHNYKELSHGVKPIFTGTMDFMRLLKARTFAEASNNIVILQNGDFLSSELLEENGFRAPVLVKSAEGLGLVLPPKNFTVYDVEQHVGSMQEIHVIDVAKQEDMKMKMREWTEYYNCPIRTKVLNVISLEFSKTQLSLLVSPPAIVREISWVENVWPQNLNEESPYAMPYVQKYCLMGVKDCYTDFHVDFGGTSVWYHVFRGEKIFYLIEPTDENLAKYENWVSSSNQSQVFFGDRVSKCIKCSVKQGQTLFIPTGWIHAVMTPIDTLVFGGNFLHSVNIGLQFKIYELEQRLNTPIKFLFPNYETTCWYAARAILKKIKGIHREETKMPEFLFKGVNELVRYLRNWTNHKEDFLKFHKFQVPEELNHVKLIRALAKELKYDMRMVFGSGNTSMKVSVIVMTERKGGKPKKSEKKNSATVIRLKLTGPSPNIDEKEVKESKKMKKLKETICEERVTEAKTKKIRTSVILQDDRSKGNKQNKKMKRRRDRGKPEFKVNDAVQNDYKNDIIQSMQVQVSNGRIKSGSVESFISGNQFKPLLATSQASDLRDDLSQSSTMTLEDQDWQAAQLLSNFHGMDTQGSTQSVLPVKDIFAGQRDQSFSLFTNVRSSQKVPKGNILDQIDAVKEDLFGGHRSSDTKKVDHLSNSCDSDDDYVIRTPMVKPQGGLKRNRSETDSDYDPEEEYYQDANFVYPRLKTTSDLDYDDFSWNPGQRSKRKTKKTLSPQSKLNSQIAFGGHIMSLDDTPSQHERPANDNKDKSQSTEKKREKVRKGNTTAKQRLGKLLKLDKLGGRYLR